VTVLCWSQILIQSIQTIALFIDWIVWYTNCFNLFAVIAYIICILLL